MKHQPKPLPSQAYLSECFDYDHNTGMLTWRSRPLNHFKNQRGHRVFQSNFAGKQAFTCLDNGYFHGAINGTIYKAHRVVWKLCMGTEPEMIDHINGDRADNRLCNLRPANPTINARNARLRIDSKSGLKGVSWCNTHKKWMAQIRVDTKTKYLGHFHEKLEAYEAYKEAAINYHGDAANFGTEVDTIESKE